MENEATFPGYDEYSFTDLVKLEEDDEKNKNFTKSNVELTVNSNPNVKRKDNYRTTKERKINSNVGLPEEIIDLQLLADNNYFRLDYNNISSYATIKSISHTINDERKKLSRVQYDTIFQNGTFRVDVEDSTEGFVWKLNKRFITGIHNIKTSFLNNLSTIKYFFRSFVTNRIIGDIFSLRSSLSGLKIFILKFLDLSIGFPHLKYEEEYIVEKILESELIFFTSLLHLRDQDRPLMDNLKKLIGLLKKALIKRNQKIDLYMNVDCRELKNSKKHFRNEEAQEQLTEYLKNVKTENEKISDEIIETLLDENIIEGNILNAQTVFEIDVEISRILFILEHQTHHLVSYTTAGGGEVFDSRIFDKRLLKEVEWILDDIFALTYEEEKIAVEKIYSKYKLSLSTEEIVGKWNLWNYKRIEQAIMANVIIDEICWKYYPNSSSNSFKRTLIRNVGLFIFISSSLDKILFDKKSFVEETICQEKKTHKFLSKFSNWNEMTEESISYKYDKSNQFKLHYEILNRLKNFHQLHNERDGDVDHLISSFIFDYMANNFQFWNEEFPQLHSRLMEKDNLRVQPKRIYRFDAPILFPKFYRLIRTCYLQKFDCHFKISCQPIDRIMKDNLTLCSGTMREGSKDILEGQVLTDIPLKNESFNYRSFSEISYEYEIRRKEEFVCSTSSYFWRWKNFGFRYYSWTKRLLVLFFYTLLVSSNFGLRTVFQVKPFYEQYRVNYMTHRIELDDCSLPVETLWSSVITFWRNEITKMNSFKLKFSFDGILFKYLIYFSYWIWNILIKCFFGTNVLIIIHISNAFFLSIISIILGLLSPFIVIFPLIIYHSFCFFVYDLDLPLYNSTTNDINGKYLNNSKILPIFNLFFHQFLLHFIFEFIILFLMIVVVIPVISVIIIIFLVLRLICRSILDIINYFICIRKKTLIPTSQNTFCFSLIETPKTGKNYTTKVEPEFLQLIFLVQLELEELNRLERLILISATNGEKLLKEMSRNFMKSILVKEKMESLPHGEQFCREKLLSELRERKKKINNFILLHSMFSKGQNYKLCEKDLGKFRGTCQYFLQQLYHHHLDSYSPQNIWMMTNIEEGSWNQLTNWFIRKFFDSTLLIPLTEYEIEKCRNLQFDYEAAKLMFWELCHWSSEEEMERFCAQCECQNFLNFENFKFNEIKSCELFPRRKNEGNEWTRLIGEKKRIPSNCCSIDIDHLRRKRIDNKLIYVDRLQAEEIIHLNVYSIYHLLLYKIGQE
ncbi:hypothetical protein SNEBB_005504 [Seison nebaliae]|nr:hypothetical protein SNEBB_005504 [Seison nebaliae]